VHPRVAALVSDISDAYPRFRLVSKERSPFMRLLAALLFFNRGFLTGYTTTIGYRVYMPAALIGSDEGWRVLRHERVHLEQFRRHPVWFPVSYLLFAPALVTMRAVWEMEGYVESMRAELEETGTIAADTVDWIERRFTGPDYLFMDVRRRRVRARLSAERTRLLGTL
jgi:hypothetical protein